MGQTGGLNADAATVETTHKPTAAVGALELGRLSELSSGRQGRVYPWAG